MLLARMPFFSGSRSRKCKKPTEIDWETYELLLKELQQKRSHNMSVVELRSNQEKIIDYIEKYDKKMAAAARKLYAHS